MITPLSQKFAFSFAAPRANVKLRLAGSRELSNLWDPYLDIRYQQHAIDREKNLVECNIRVALARERKIGDYGDHGEVA